MKEPQMRKSVTWTPKELAVFDGLRAIEADLHAIGETALASRLYAAGCRIGSLAVDLKRRSR